MLALLLVPGLSCVRGYFSGAFPFWIAGALVGIFAYQKLLASARWMLPLVWLCVLIGNTLLQFDVLSGAWTMPIADLLALSLGVPLGLHLKGVSIRNSIQG